MGKTGSIAVQLTEILDEYNKEVKDAANNSIRKVARESVQKLRSTSPKKTGSYARGWGTKTEGGIGGIQTVTVHNKTDYQLTHLLENGHIVRNKKGTYGRAPAIKHIAPVEQWANSELPAEIERELQ